MTTKSAPIYMNAPLFKKIIATIFGKKMTLTFSLYGCQSITAYLYKDNFYTWAKIMRI